MTNHKFTDERIIRCLNECSGKENVVAHIVDQGEDELVTLGRLLEIINRQKAEVEEQKEIIEIGKNENVCVGVYWINDFAERLKAEIRNLYARRNGDATLYLVVEAFIDIIVKEMTEGKT